MNIALIAHDGRKMEMLSWIEYNALTLAHHNLYATGTTGRLISNLFKEMAQRENLNNDISPLILLKASENINCLLSGPLGGDQQAGAMIAQGDLDVLIFFCDNLAVQGHQNDVSALARLASLYNIAYATNRTTADMILTSPLFDNPNYHRITPNVIENYKNRPLNNI